MPLTLVLGPRGSGKTNFIIKKVRESLRDIYSNVKINLPNYKKFELENLYDIPPNVELIFDEGYAIIDSRLSMGYIASAVTYIAFQLRKTNVNIFITAQQVGSIDVRYRKEWDYVVMCERSPNNKKDWRLWDFLYTILCKRTGTTTRWLWEYKKSLSNFFYYDTNQIIQPRNKSRIFYELKKTNPEMYYQWGLIIYKKIQDQIKKGTKNEIELTLLKNGYTSMWKNIVYLHHHNN